MNPMLLAVEPHKQLVVEAAAIEDKRELSLAEDLTDGCDDVGHGVGEVGRQLHLPAKPQSDPAALRLS
jgi:hypothetical protein